MLDAHTAPGLLRSWHALHAAIDRELEPHIPPAPYEEALAASLSDENTARRRWLLVEADAVVGSALLEQPLLDNPHLAMLDVRVEAGHRRRGLGTRLIGIGARAAHEAGRRTLLFEAIEGTAADSMLAALGAELALGSTASVLRLADLDRSMVEQWITRRSERAAGYSLVRWIGFCPDEHLEAVAKLREAMNTAPLGELDLVIEWPPGRVRAVERANLRCGWRNYVVVARHDETGDLVGLTDVNVPVGRPTVAFQEDTVVRPDHRNRGLGRWIKAEMLRWLAAEEPQLELIATWNATENAAMLAINVELGFTPAATWNEWQFDVEDLLERLRLPSKAEPAQL